MCAPVGVTPRAYVSLLFLKIADLEPLPSELLQQGFGRGASRYPLHGNARCFGCFGHLAGEVQQPDGGHQRRKALGRQRNTTIGRLAVQDEITSAALAVDADLSGADVNW